MDLSTIGMVSRPGESAVGNSLQENLAPRGPCRWEGDSVTSRQTSNEATTGFCVTIEFHHAFPKRGFVRPEKV
jgi:hypothetical protein